LPVGQQRGRTIPLSDFVSQHRFNLFSDFAAMEFHKSKHW
jgi:hypothetical protein